jgi:hypothetical protein
VLGNPFGSLFFGLTAQSFGAVPTTESVTTIVQTQLYKRKPNCPPRRYHSFNTPLTCSQPGAVCRADAVKTVVSRCGAKGGGVASARTAFGVPTERCRSNPLAEEKRIQQNMNQEPSRKNIPLRTEVRASTTASLRSNNTSHHHTDVSLLPSSRADTDPCKTVPYLQSTSAL